jgi:hypothetical protein
MRKSFKQNIKELLHDDLFVRMMQLFAGLGLAVLGVLCLFAAQHEALASEGRLLSGGAAAIFLLLATTFLVFCCAPADSRIGRVAKKFVPDAAGLDDAALLVIVIALPAAVLTSALRRLGFGKKA